MGGLQRLARIETKLDIYLKDHETRMRGMEARQWWLTGFGALAAFIATKIPWTMQIG